jgi:hypothetical protein
LIQPSIENSVPSVAQNIVDAENAVLVEAPGVSMEDIQGLARNWVPED